MYGTMNDGASKTNMSSVRLGTNDDDDDVVDDATCANGFNTEFPPFDDKFIACPGDDVDEADERFVVVKLTGLAEYDEADAAANILLRPETMESVSVIINDG